YDRAVVLLDPSVGPPGNFTDTGGGSGAVTRTIASDRIRSTPGGAYAVPAWGRTILQFSFTGSVDGMIAVQNGTPVGLAGGGTAVPQAALSDVFPVTGNLDPNNFIDNIVGVIPFAICTKDFVGHNLSAVDNFNQREMTFFFPNGGLLPGSATADQLGGSA